MNIDLLRAEYEPWATDDLDRLEGIEELLREADLFDSGAVAEPLFLALETVVVKPRKVKPLRGKAPRRPPQRETPQPWFQMPVVVMAPPDADPALVAEAAMAAERRLALDAPPYLAEQVFYEELAKRVPW